MSYPLHYLIKAVNSGAVLAILYHIQDIIKLQSMSAPITHNDDYQFIGPKKKPARPKASQTIIFIILGIVVAIVCYIAFFTDLLYERNPAGTTAGTSDSGSNIKVIQQWEMPKELKEISGMVPVDSLHVACIQDTDGTIFIYNLQADSIERRINFAGGGDYEALALVDSTYYVLRSDGFIYEFTESGEGTPKVTTYDIPLGAEQDTESLLYDEKNNRLLIAVKEKDPTEKDRKGIYSFDLATKKMDPKAVFMIEANAPSSASEQTKDNEKNDNGDSDNGDGKKKKGKKNGKGKSNAEIKPSEFALNNNTGELYILDGPEARLFIVGLDGKIRAEYDLDKKVFPQPEGIFLTSAGELFISTEASKEAKAVLAKVRL
jgi:uncharacterized protein YjiK